MYHKSTRQSGFTIIELTLAMTFLAFVMIFSATIVVQMSQSYIKGLTIKQVNQAGRTITDDLSRSIQASASSGIKIGSVDTGVLCVGRVAYIWNPVYTPDDDFNNIAVNRYRLDGEIISLARVDSERVSNCDGGFFNTHITAGPGDASLLSDNTRVIKASASQSAIDSRLVNLHFILGTFESSEISYLSAGNYSEIANSVYYDEASNSYTCRPDRFGNFCAFSEFETTVYVAR